MIEVLKHIDDFKVARNLIKAGDKETAIKHIEECIAHHQNEVDAFDKWADEEAQKDYDNMLPQDVKMPFPEGVR